MPDGFRSFVSILTERADGPDSADLPAVVQTPVPANVMPADERVIDLLDGFVAELARLRARAVERFEEQAEALLADIARRVLGRELASAPPDIAALLADAFEELGSAPGVIVRVCPADAQRLRERWPVESDPALRPGDFAVEIDDGLYDAALQTRLDAVLALHRIAL